MRKRVQVRIHSLLCLLFVVVQSHAMLANDMPQVDIFRDGKVIVTRALTSEERAVLSKLQHEMKALQVEQQPLIAIEKKMLEYQDMSSKSFDSLINKLTLREVSAVARIQKIRQKNKKHDEETLRQCRKKYHQKMRAVKALNAKLNQLIKLQQQDQFTIRS